MKTSHGGARIAFTLSAPSYLDRMLDPVGPCLTPEVAGKLARVTVDPEIQERIDELADNNTEGELTPDERKELESYVRAGNLIAILQAKARKLANQPEAA